MGYGSRALQALNSFYSGELFSLDESAAPEKSYPDPIAIDPVSNSASYAPSCSLITNYQYSRRTFCPSTQRCAPRRLCLPCCNASQKGNRRPLIILASRMALPHNF